MAYVQYSTRNPLGFRPWQSRLGYYRPARFVLPTSDMSGLGYVQFPNFAGFARKRDWVARERILPGGGGAPIPRIYVPPELAPSRLINSGLSGLGLAPRYAIEDAGFGGRAPRLAVNDDASVFRGPVRAAPRDYVFTPPTPAPRQVETEAAAAYRVDPSTGQYKIFPHDVPERGIWAQNTFQAQAPAAAVVTPMGEATLATGTVQVQLPNGQQLTVSTAPSGPLPQAQSKMQQFLNSELISGVPNKWLLLGTGLALLVRRS